MNTAFIDTHVHCVPRDGGVRFHGWRRYLAAWLGKRSGTQGETGPAAARAYMNRLTQQLKQAHRVRRAVLLSMDRSYDSHGRLTDHMSGYHVPHGDVQAWCSESPELFLFGASVHPHRPYFRKLAELQLPLLVHTGAELVLPSQRQAWGDIRQLRPALDAGVTVIAAHGGSSGLFLNGATLRHYASLLRACPNLYGDTAALALPNRMGALLWWRDHAEWADRLLFGTDYPVPVSIRCWRPFVARADYARLKNTANPFDRMAMLLEALGINLHPSAFESLLNCRSAG